MAQGKVIINELNLFQGSLTGVEKQLLFIGIATLQNNTWLTLDARTDLDVLLGAAPSALKTQLLAARANGGPTWSAYAVSRASGTPWATAMNAAIATLGTVLDFEGIVLCDAITVTADIDGVSAALNTLATRAINPFALVACAGIDKPTQDWTTYKSAMSSLRGLVVDKRICLVPLLHGNDIGVLAGRLCRADVSVADSPMRTKTGSVTGLGAVPMDRLNALLDADTLRVLDGMGFSCKQQYINYPGTYWGDANTLDAPAGDFLVLENVRVIRKAQRAIRVLSIARLADRKLNNTPASMASAKQYFLRPLRDMSKSLVVGAYVFPGDIKAPQDDAVTIVWTSKTEVQVFLKLCPYESPKTLTANLMLDLSLGTVAVK
jgi:hypothetical protein